MIRAGDKSPTFSLTVIDGHPLHSQDLLGPKPLVLAFFKVSCPTCQFGLPFLTRADLSQFRLLAVSQDSISHTNQFAERFSAPLHYVLDRAEENYPASNAFGITHVPTIFVINEQGRVETVIEGFDKSAFEDLGVTFEDSEKIPNYKPG
jgi:peroxiredoxin